MNNEADMKPDASIPSERSGLPNFSRADDILQAAEVFWVRAARMVNPATGAPKAPADAAFFAYLAAELVRLSEQLTRYRNGDVRGSLETWVQYTPERSLPTEADLAALTQPYTDADEAMRIVNQLNQRWLDVFEELAARMTSPSAKELFQSCRDLLVTRACTLASACAQRHES